MNIITDHLQKIQGFYTQDSYFDLMKAAKAVFIEKTGKMDEDAQEYEARMNSFNDWFAFNYLPEASEKLIEVYLKENQVEAEIAQSFRCVNYSLFHFKKINFRKQIVINDILHSKKFVLAKDSDMLALVEDDLFVSRSIEYKENHYLLPGLCLLPREILSILKKESKKIRKQENQKLEEDFLLKIEALKIRSLQYGHLESSDVFKFSS